VEDLMQTNEVGPGQAVVTVSLDEIYMMQNAINEALEAVADAEFQTRTGYTRAEMRALWAQLDELAVQIQRG
jgi:hypothetical protein